ncbi:hypothetical protein BU24DRAFT_81199 [Aaosphaeria arxii CBS 175.79]|uniref:Uncharacterized protein n=1 Tax=Aaosphaeria arxii CBS 175.79 TaxID=1450172 RepID=A0A6A5X9X4_9PLEO|nr:uncharacterized protein BU24DRAFT_81199 [Aaosphaeria arxii CBS 175.79]KAF2009709.1 hypothetical protein BU24DRAFT_81199 [Aaosphaeria arxii CBS 175.79]
MGNVQLAYLDSAFTALLAGSAALSYRHDTRHGYSDCRCGCGCDRTRLLQEVEKGNTRDEGKGPWPANARSLGL